MTGLSGSGKSTLAHGRARRMLISGEKPLLVDGDMIRLALSHDLGFSLPERTENIRRGAAVAMIAAHSGITSICSFISPLKSQRESIRKLCEGTGKTFLEVYIAAPLDVCEQRDPKGLYKKARSGLIKEFTGIDSPFEIPDNPDLILETGEHSVQECLDLLEARIRTCGSKH